MNDKHLLKPWTLGAVLKKCMFMVTSRNFPLDSCKSEEFKEIGHTMIHGINIIIKSEL